MSVPAITLTNLTKTYGSSRGVNDVNLKVEQGEVFGFLGPNGAGKSTTIRMMLDFIRPTAGSIQLLGLDSTRDSVAIHRRVGYLSGDMAMDERLTGRQYLEYTANLHGGVPWSNTQRLIDRLRCETDKKISKLSRGNKQKVGLVAALMHSPDLLVLDEPTSGLDPLMQAEFNKLIQEHRQQGKTAFISSHVLSEVQEICDHVGFISDGKLHDVQPLQGLKQSAFRKVSFTLGRAVKPTTFAAIKGISDVTVEDKTVRCRISGDFTPLIRVLAKHSVKDLTVEESDLEDLFIQYYQGAGDAQ